MMVPHGPLLRAPLPRLLRWPSSRIICGCYLDVLQLRSRSARNFLLIRPLSCTVQLRRRRFRYACVSPVAAFCRPHLPVLALPVATGTRLTARPVSPFPCRRDGTTAAKKIARFNGTSWSVVAGPVNGAGNIIGVNGKVTLMTVYKNRLYLAGECTGSSTIHGFSNAPTANLYLVSHLPPPPAGNFFQLSDRTTWARYVVAWDGTAWFPLPGTGVGYFVNAFAIFNDKL